MSKPAVPLIVATWLLAAIAATSSFAAEPVLPSAPPESVGFSSQRLQRLDAYIRKLIDTGHMPGAAVMVARHGKVVKFDVYGKDAGSRKPLARDAIYRIYSQSKPVTGVALMILFEEGKWRFDDPVTKFIPEFGDLQVFKAANADGSMQLEKLARPPTMRELLTHTAGFGYGLDGMDTQEPVGKAYHAADFMRAANADDAIRRIAKIPLASQPGVQWRYSAAVDIQGYIVERLSGQTLGDFMRTRIFEPLGMKDTAFYVPADKSSRFVSLQAYDPASKRLVPPTGNLVFDYSKPPGAASGGAGLVSTTSDYARFAQMILNEGELGGVRILAPSTVRLLASNHLTDAIRAAPDGPFSTQSGLGFAVDFDVVTDVTKTGMSRGLGTLSWAGAAGSWFWIDPANDLFVLGMMQVMNRWADSSMQSIDADTSALVYSSLVAPDK
jgi:CubicO group peptidase (beta-lactamase class C family)